LPAECHLLKEQRGGHIYYLPRLTSQFVGQCFRNWKKLCLASIYPNSKARWLSGSSLANKVRQLPDSTCYSRKNREMVRNVPASLINLGL
jgi:hypothetical protein